jgi:hypothetical protein
MSTDMTEYETEIELLKRAQISSELTYIHRCNTCLEITLVDVRSGVYDYNLQRLKGDTYELKRKCSCRRKKK